MEQAAKGLIEEVHSQNRVWNQTLAFYIDELNIFLNRLEEIYFKNTSLQIREKIDDLLNNLINLRIEVDILQRQIDQLEQKALKYKNLRLKHIDYVTTEVYQGIKTEIEIFEKVYKERKKELMKFLSTWM